MSAPSRLIEPFAPPASRPFLLVAVALLIGACAALYLPPLGKQLAYALLPALIVLVLLAWRTRQIKASLVLYVAAVLISGLLYTHLRLNYALATRIADREEALTLSVLASVDDLPRLDGDRLSLQVRTLEDLPQLSSASLLRLTWYQFDPAKAPPLTPGDCARFELRLRGARGPANVAGWDAERSALTHRWAARGSIRSAAAVACDRGWSLDRARWLLAAAVDRQLPPGPERAALKALTLGDTREFSDEHWAQLRRSGLSHLMAISGLHIGLLAGFGALLGSAIYRLRPRWSEFLPRPQAQALMALSFAAGYAALAGFSMPTQRALVALLAFLAARLLRRALGVWSAYALALAAVLLVDPLAPLNAGFWLSFGAAGWLLYLFARGGRPRPKWRSLLLAQGVLALGLWPLTARWFQQGSLIGPLLNLLVVPWVAIVVVPLALSGVAATVLLPEVLAQPLLQLAAATLTPLWWLLQQLEPWQVSTATATPPLIGVLLAMLGAAWLFAPYGVRWRWLAPLLWLPLLWPRPLAIEPGAVIVNVLDVGQGQAILIRTRGHSALIDAGPAAPGGFDAGEAMVVPSLRALGVTGLDLLMLSHADSDHAGGRGAVLSAFVPDAQMARLPRPEPKVSDCTKGDQWDWDGVQFQLLHPPVHFPYLGNESSCVLRVEDAFGAVVLIPGDIGTNIEQRLLREQPELLPATVLIAPHHGSAGSSSATFVAAVNPQWVIYSAGWGNRFQMPRSETLARVAVTDAVQYSTARSGAIDLISDGAGNFAIKSQRGAHPLPWRGADLGPYSVVDKSH